MYIFWWIKNVNKKSVLFTNYYFVWPLFPITHYSASFTHRWGTKFSYLASWDALHFHLMCVFLYWTNSLKSKSHQTILRKSRLAFDYIISQTCSKCVRLNNRVTRMPGFLSFVYVTTRSSIFQQRSRESVYPYVYPRALLSSTHVIFWISSVDKEQCFPFDIDHLPNALI